MGAAAPRQNRVLPTGEIVAHPARGRFMGNRGILHDAAGQLGDKTWAHKAWVTCRLSFKGRHRALMQPGHYTELFFHDEAVALAAGHRPCGECRRADYLAFRDAAGIHGPIARFDDVLHAARAVPRKFRQRRHVADLASLPDGAFVLLPQGGPTLVVGPALHPFSPTGYGAPLTRPASVEVTVLTPEPTLRALHGGYMPAIAL